MRRSGVAEARGAERPCIVVGPGSRPDEQHVALAFDRIGVDWDGDPFGQSKRRFARGRGSAAFIGRDRKRVLETLVLRAVKHNRADILAVPHLQPQRDVVARTKLVHQPTDTVSLIARRMFVASHGSAGPDEASRARDGGRERAMLVFAVAMRDVVRSVETFQGHFAHCRTRFSL